MLFNSLDFAIFLPVVFLVYWFVAGKTIRIQNIFCVVASYIFYGWWDWRFLSLIFISTLVDFVIGRAMYSEHRFVRRRVLLGVSLLVNIGSLGFFKYYNFFIDSFVSAFTFLGYPVKVQGLNIVLPVGISFYTFQTLSYSIDVYRKKLEPTRDFVAFAAFVSFFPQLVAGPIERATHLLPQFLRERTFSYEQSVEGLRQMLWGLFKKVVVADNAAVVVNQIFGNHQNYSGSTLILGAVLFAFQIYGDFSGYSDIAIGVSKLFGFRLSQNFAFPYFSRDIAEFWRRWHISLSTWFRDYLYIPLGGSRGNTWKRIRNVFIIFMVSGLWHGANWTFIIWGAINACYFLPLFLLKINRTHTQIIAPGRIIPPIREFTMMLLTFLLVVLGWVFFRAENLMQAVAILSEIFSNSLFSLPQIIPFKSLVLILLLIIVEWLGREGEFALDCLLRGWGRFYRWAFYVVLLLFIYFLGNFSEKFEFIYFQF